MHGVLSSRLLKMPDDAIRSSTGRFLLLWKMLACVGVIAKKKKKVEKYLIYDNRINENGGADCDFTTEISLPPPTHTPTHTRARARARACTYLFHQDVIPSECLQPPSRTAHSLSAAMCCVPVQRAARLAEMGRHRAVGQREPCSRGHFSSLSCSDTAELQQSPMAVSSAALLGSGESALPAQNRDAGTKPTSATL